MFLDIDLDRLAFLRPTRRQARHTVPGVAGADAARSRTRGRAALCGTQARTRLLVLAVPDHDDRAPRLSTGKEVEEQVLTPRVALVHPWLTNQGGAERVLESLCRAFPDAPVYTSVYEPSALPAFAGRDVRTSFLQRWPGRHRHQLYPLLRRRAFESFDLDAYDVVLSSDFGEAKGVLTGPRTTHVAYVHTPTRYLWSDYRSHLSEPGLGRWDPVARTGLSVLAARMRTWDYLAAQRPDHLLANSRTVAHRIAKYYGREAQVMHPPVELRRFSANGHRSAHFLVVSRLVRYKRVDLAVQACAALDLPLRVVGTGPELARLQSLAGPRTTFLGRLDDEAVAREYCEAAALLFPGEEDFGITPLEAMASGTPVLALGRGGALETVVDGVTGAFFPQQTLASLVEALGRFDPGAYEPRALRRQAERFSEADFVRRVRERVLGLHDAAPWHT